MLLPGRFMIHTLSSLALTAGVDINAKSYETAEGTFGKPSLSFVESMGGRPLSSGVRFSPEGAMQASALNACVRVRGESLASLPLVTFRRKGTGKERAVDASLYRILHDRPNPWQTSFEWREMMQEDFDLRGNAYSLIERNKRGEIQHLYPLQAAMVTVLKDETSRLPFYRCSELKNSPVLSRENIFHLRGRTRDGYRGISPIQEAAEAIGLSIAAERYGAGLFASGGLHPGLLIFNGTITQEEYETFRKSIDERLGVGGKGGGRIPLIDGDFKYEKTGMRADQAQALETRGWQVQEIARLYRMPLPMIGHNDKTATYASAEQFFLAFVKHCLLPVATRWEQAFRRDLLLDDESELEPLFILEGLLRGDIKTRYEAYAIGRTHGFLNADEIRANEDENPIPDGKGQIYLQQANMVELGSGPQKTGKILEAWDTLGSFLREHSKELDIAA